jgi:poly(3-hydroxybutyrate) depolymerase
MIDIAAPRDMHYAPARMLLYQAYQAHNDLLRPVRLLAEATAGTFRLPVPGLSGIGWLRRIAAVNQLLAGARLSHERPAFGIARTRLGNDEVAVHEEAVQIRPFGTLLRFRKDVETAQPRVLLVAPMSGHFATLLRGTVETMLPDHDVYITDWHNARSVPLHDGRFDFDDFIDHVIGFIERIGADTHVVAVCQPSVAVLAAAALMAQESNPVQPRSITLMAGPIDTRVNPTAVNALAQRRSIGWFERRLIGTVPLRHPGALRRVYPGFVQLTSFMAMNLERHLKAHRDLYDHLLAGDTARAEAIRSFYDEYFAVMDLPAEFYLETVRLVFQEHRLALGTLTSRDVPVEPRAIRRTALLTIEGEKDDICAVGQTLAAHDLCSGIRPFMKRHYVQTGVGHYGVFNGRRWQTQVYPIVRNFILAAS